MWAGRPPLRSFANRIFSERTGSMQKKVNVRWLAVTAILGAVAAVLMMLSISVPIIPSFVKLDFSELPALIAAFAMGPVSGVGVCLIKNLVNLPTSYSAGIGELCNFLLGVAFVLPAGLFYKFKKDRFGALWGSLLGALIMGIASFPINYCITYPFYINAGIMSLDAILDAYQLILPSVETLPQALWIFNAPFTFFKALCDVAITFLLYKHLSPLLKGKTL